MARQLHNRSSSGRACLSILVVMVMDSWDLVRRSGLPVRGVELAGGELLAVLVLVLVGGNHLVARLQAVPDHGHVIVLVEHLQVASPDLVDVAEVADGRLNRGVVALSIEVPSSRDDVGQEAAE